MTLRDLTLSSNYEQKQKYLTGAKSQVLVRHMRSTGLDIDNMENFYFKELTCTRGIEMGELNTTSSNIFFFISI